MSRICKFVFLFVISATTIFGQEPHLMLHFDINKTIIASDKAGGKSIENVLNQMLAKKYQSKWDKLIEESISYDDYVRKILLPGPEYDLELKSKRRDYLDHFLNHLRKTNDPLYPDVLKTYNEALEILGNSKGIVFPSFYRLLDDLDQRDISYTILLRSFGEEVYEIGEEINKTHKKMIHQNGAFKEGVLFVEGKEVEDNHKMSYERLRYLGHIAIRDDWKHWMSGKLDSKYGKPFYVDPDDTSILAIFFDDHIHLDDRDENIIAPIHAKTGKLLSREKLTQKGQIVQVDTLEAILNENYFVDLVQKAIDLQAKK